MAPESLAIQARNRFLGFHENLKDRLGVEFRPDKTLEVAKLDRAFAAFLRSRLRGKDFVRALVARLSWDQALPNVNHRTTLSFLHAMLAAGGIDVPWRQAPDGLTHARRTKHWMKRSKEIMGERDQRLEGSKPWKDLEARQKKETCDWLSQEDQSGKLAYAGPNLLKNFLSSSVSMGRGSG